MDGETGRSDAESDVAGATNQSDADAGDNHAVEKRPPRRGGGRRKNDDDSDEEDEVEEDEDDQLDESEDEDDWEQFQQESQKVGTSRAHRQNVCVGK